MWTSVIADVTSFKTYSSERMCIRDGGRDGEKDRERPNSDKICSSCWGRRLQRDWNSRRSYLAFHFTTFSTETLPDKQVSKHTVWDRETKTSKFSRYVYMDERSSVMKMFHGCSPVPGFCKSFQSRAHNGTGSEDGQKGKTSLSILTLVWPHMRIICLFELWCSERWKKYCQLKNKKKKKRFWFIQFSQYLHIGGH